MTYTVLSFNNCWKLQLVIDDNEEESKRTISFIRFDVFISSVFNSNSSIMPNISFKKTAVCGLECHNWHQFSKLMKIKTCRVAWSQIPADPIALNFSWMWEIIKNCMYLVTMKNSRAIFVINSRKKRTLNDHANWSASALFFQEIDLLSNY